MNHRVSIITITLNRKSLKRACESVDCQTYKNWHHYVLGDGVLPEVYDNSQRSILGFSKDMGITEPGANMPNGTPNPMQRWALRNLDLAEYVCFLDDDNCYKNNYLEEMVCALDANPEIGLVLCGAEDLRYGQDIDGYPEVGRCDNSAVMYRREVVKSIEFPYASMDKNVIQDCEYIMKCSEKFGFLNLDKKLLIFGEGLNPPPNRGRYYFLESWKVPQESYYKAYDGNYIAAYGEFKKIISEFPNDAWSLWKCFELSAILNKSEETVFYGKQWDEIFLKERQIHHALYFAHATFLRYTGDVKYKEYANLAINKLYDEKEDTAEKYFALARNYRLLNDAKSYNETLNVALRLCSDKSYWAYRLSVWESIVYEALFTKDEIENYRKLER